MMPKRGIASLSNMPFLDHFLIKNRWKNDTKKNMKKWSKNDAKSELPERQKHWKNIGFYKVFVIFDLWKNAWKMIEKTSQKWCKNGPKIYQKSIKKRGWKNDEKLVGFLRPAAPKMAPKTHPNQRHHNIILHKNKTKTWEEWKTKAQRRPKPNTPAAARGPGRISVACGNFPPRALERR